MPLCQGIQKMFPIREEVVHGADRGLCLAGHRMHGHVGNAISHDQLRDGIQDGVHPLLAARLAGLAPAWSGCRGSGVWLGVTGGWRLILLTHGGVHSSGWILSQIRDRD